MNAHAGLHENLNNGMCPKSVETVNKPGNIMETRMKKPLPVRISMVRFQNMQNT